MIRRVTRVADLPHSSFHRFVESGLRPADRGGGRSESEGWARFALPTLQFVLIFSGLVSTNPRAAKPA